MNNTISRNTISRNAKWLLFLLLINTSTILCQAPSYTDFEWDVIQLGYANTSDLPGIKSGFVTGTELRYNLRDDLSIGLETDFSFYISNIDVDEDNLDLNLIASASIVVDKYLKTTSAKRFFYGLGIGQNSSALSLRRNGEELGPYDEFSSLALSARVGYELNHIRFKAQYTFNTEKEVANYLSLKMAVTLWGGYKGKEK